LTINKDDNMVLMDLLNSIFDSSLKQENEQLKIENDNIRREKIKIPHNFESIEEFVEFINQSEVDKREYVKTTYDCDDFATDLQKEALEWKDGRIINLQYVTMENGSAHMLNTVVIGNSVYQIEPQTDGYKRLCYLD